jgi:hypothetical protein
VLICICDRTEDRRCFHEIRARTYYDHYLHKEKVS